MQPLRNATQMLKLNPYAKVLREAEKKAREASSEKKAKATKAQRALHTKTNKTRRAASTGFFNHLVNDDFVRPADAAK
jgi:hypothetical protein